MIGSRLLLAETFMIISNQNDCFNRSNSNSFTRYRASTYATRSNSGVTSSKSSTNRAGSLHSYATHSTSSYDYYPSHHIIISSYRLPSYPVRYPFPIQARYLRSGTPTASMYHNLTPIERCLCEPSLASYSSQPHRSYSFDVVFPPYLSVVLL